MPVGDFSVNVLSHGGRLDVSIFRIHAEDDFYVAGGTPYALPPSALVGAAAVLRWLWWRAERRAVSRGFPVSTGGDMARP